MRTNLHTLLLSLATFVPAALAGCASSGGATTPAGPIELEGARYKMVAGGGSLDGRVVEFKKRGEDGLVGCLVEPGVRLRSVTGLNMGLRVFSLKLKPNTNYEYEGVYKAVSPDGNMPDKEVHVSFNADGMSWNLESATWERQAESSLLGEAEKATCYQ